MNCNYSQFWMTGKYPKAMKFEWVLLVVSFENVPLTNTKHLLSFSFSFSVLRNVIPMIPVSEGSQLTDHRNLRRISIICLDWSGYVRGFIRDVDTRILISHWCDNAAEYLYNRYICRFISHSHTSSCMHWQLLYSILQWIYIDEWW